MALSLPAGAGLLPMAARGPLTAAASADAGLLPMAARGLLAAAASADAGLLPMAASADAGLLPMAASAGAGLLPVAAHGLLAAAASPVVECGQCPGTGVVVHSLSCLVACGIFPD